MQNQLLLDGKIRIIAFNYDITDSKRNEEKLKKTLKEYNQLNRTLVALRNSSYAMMHATDEKSYMDDICKIIVDDCGHSMVWIGFTEEEGKKVIPVAYSGFEEDYLKTLNITCDDTEHGQGPTGTAIRTGKPSICRNMQTDPKFKPWREEAIKRGYASSIVLPIILTRPSNWCIDHLFKRNKPIFRRRNKIITRTCRRYFFWINSFKITYRTYKAEKALEESLIRTYKVKF